MTGDLIPLNESLPLRIIQSEIGLVMPAVDIADGLGYDRSTITRLISDNPDIFKGLQVRQDLPTAGGSQQFVCLNKTGVERVLLSIRPAKTREIFDKVDRFRQRAFDRLAEKSPAEPPQENMLAASLQRNADIADILITRYGYDPRVARSIAMKVVEQEVGNDVLPWRGPAALPAVSAEDAVSDACDRCPGSIADEDPEFEHYLSPTKIGEYLNVPREQVNNALEDLGYRKFQNGIWHLTKSGEMFGKVFTTYPLWPHRLTPKVGIRWSPDIMPVLKSHFDKAGSGKQALPAHG